MSEVSPIIININGTEKKRTWRVELFTEIGTDYPIRGHRETVILDENNDVYKRTRDGVVKRNLSEVVADEVTLDDSTVLTGAQIAEAISKIVDQWADEDEAAAAAEPDGGDV